MPVHKDIHCLLVDMEMGISEHWKLNRRKQYRLAAVLKCRNRGCVGRTAWEPCCTDVLRAGNHNDLTIEQQISLRYREIVGIGTINAH